MKTVKLHIMSDLHVDHHQHDGGKAFIETISAESQPDEVLIIAGDLFDGFRDLQKCKERMRKIAKGWKHVVYVMGNHEFLSHTPAEALEAAWNTCAGVDNLSLLENSSVTIDGLRIHGATSWYGRPTAEATVYKYHMIDYNYIKSFEPWVYSQHAKTQKYVLDNVKDGEVFVSHHLPFEWCVRPFWKTHPLNPFFVSRFEDLYQTSKIKPALIVCGHTHDQFDETQNGLRVVCNSAGYPSEYGNVNRRFKLDKVVEIPVQERDNGEAS